MESLILFGFLFLILLLVFCIYYFLGLFFFSIKNQSSIGKGVCDIIIEVMFYPEAHLYAEGIRFKFVISRIRSINFRYIKFSLKEIIDYYSSWFSESRAVIRYAYLYINK